MKNSTRAVGSSWIIFDSQRGIVTSWNEKYLVPNSSGEEYTGDVDFLDINANWFQIMNSWDTIGGHVNNDGSDMIYCAIRAPQKEPVNSAEVFAVDTESSVLPVYNSNFAVDMAIERKPSDVAHTDIYSRLNQGKRLITNLTVAETSMSAAMFDYSDGWNSTIGHSAGYYSWMFKRAPGFFDVVAYEGDVNNPNRSHNLGVIPELKIIKNRTSDLGWIVGGSVLGGSSNRDHHIFMNSSDWKISHENYFDAEDTTTEFGVRANNGFSGNPDDSYISYLFASIPDVSKVGSYTGTAADLDIDAGFTNGTKFVLIKRTDSTGDWYLYDAERGIVEGNDPYLLLNTTDAEVTSTDYIDPLDAGFTITSSAPAALNASGGEYIYLAIANDNGKVRGAYDTEKAYTAVTNINSQIDSSTWADVNSVSVTETVPAESTETPEAVDFDGEEDYLSRSSDLVGNQDSKTFTFSGWVYPETQNLGIYRIGAYTFQVSISSNGEFYIIARNTSDTNILIVKSPPNSIPVNTFSHIVISLDLSDTGKRHIYINDVEVTWNWSLYTNSVINFTNSSPIVGKAVNGVGTKRISNIYLDHTYRDLSQEANRRLFITEDGKPAENQEDLNPILYLPLESAETAGENLGTGGDFTVNGTLSTSERGPNQYNASASEFGGNGDELILDPSNISANKIFTLSYSNKGSGNCFNFIDNLNNSRLSLSRLSTGRFYLHGRNSSNTTVLSAMIGEEGSPDNWKNISISLNLSNQSASQVFINGVSQNVSFDTFTDDFLDFSEPLKINYDGFTDFEMGELYFDTSYIDLSQNNPFWNSNENKPAYLGQNGELPTGSAPLIYLPLQADDAGKNLGTGGDFTVNGMLEGARGPSEFWANSAEFDGSTGGLKRDGAIPSISDSKTATLIALFKTNTQTTKTIFDERKDWIKTRFGLKQISSSVYLQCSNNSNTDILSYQIPINTNNEWQLFMFSLDMNNSSLTRIYINGEVQNVSPAIYVNDFFGLTSVDDWYIGNVQNTEHWDDNIGFLYFDDSYIDFSQESNRLKFVDALGNPKYIGQNGELPTGSAPLIYMPFKDSDNLGYNAGTGGDFTVNGTVTFGSGGPFPNEPSNVNTYAHYAVSFDGRTSFAAFDSAQAAWRSVARDNVGTWQYNSAVSGLENWINCTTNTQAACLSQAMSNTANQMTGAEFIAISDADWEATGGFTSLTTNTIDVAVSLQSESTTLTPNVDIVTFDYDPILNIAPNDPTLNNYNSGATITDTTPTLNFDLSDPDESEEGEEIKYQIQIDNNADFASPEVDFTEIAFTTSPRSAVEYTASGLSDGQWYWRVKAIDDDGLESDWSTASNGFKIDISLPESKILYPQDKASLKNVNYIFGRSTDSQGVDKTRISIRNLTTGKYYTGTGFTADAETWIDTNPTGANQTRTRWWIAAPNWADFQTYTIRSRAIDMAGNEEHTDAITFTYDTVNGSEGSLYVSNPGVDNNSDYTIFYPNSDPVANGGYIEIDFDNTFAFSPWLEDSDVTLSDNGGNITASTDSFDRLNKTIRSTITGGNVNGGDIIELAVSNLKIHNPSATGSYALPIRIYNSSDILIEAGTGTITLVENYRQVEVNVNIAESLQLRVDSGSVLLEVDPDVQLGQNWTGTGGAVIEKTEVEVKTNAQGGYNLLISLAGNTATGSAVLDGQILSGSQITSTTGDRVSIENNFTFGVNSGTAATVTAFNNASTQVSGAGSSNATNSYIDNIFYYLNIDYTTPADTYAGTVTYTAVGQF